MDRKSFLRKSALTGIIGLVAPQYLKATTQETETSTYDRLMERVGFNHLPNKERKTMNKVIHKAGTRGVANHGWLKSYHTFSFANYHNPERMHFGVLRVLNDDRVNAGKGFSTHPHDNMEIISIPLSGDLEHKDSMGNVAVIKEGDIQVMSAGTGVFHSEYNKNKDREVQFLQIWVFPNQKNVEPRYDQISIRDLEKDNAFAQVLSPNKADKGVWIHQDAWFSIGKFSKGKKADYTLKKSGNGIYLFVLEGGVEVNGERLSKRDGIGLWELQSLSLEAHADARVLLMDVPMQL